jgi:hypothetical protein
MNLRLRAATSEDHLFLWALNRVADVVMCYQERFSTKGLFENAVYQGIPEAQAGVVANTDREKMPLNFGPRHDAVIG